MKRRLLLLLLYFGVGVSAGSVVMSTAYQQLIIRKLDQKPEREPEWFKYQQRVVIAQPFWNGMNGTVCGLVHRAHDGKCEYLVRLDVDGYLALWFETQELRPAE